MFEIRKRILRSNTEVGCIATVKLNNAAQGEFVYRFFLENGKLFVEVQLPSEGLPLR